MNSGKVFPVVPQKAGIKITYLAGTHQRIFLETIYAHQWLTKIETQF